MRISRKLLAGLTVSLFLFMGSTYYWLERQRMIMEEHQFYTISSVESQIQTSLSLPANHSYEITISLRDRDERAASVSGYVKIVLDGHELASKNLSDYNQGGEDYEPNAYDSLVYGFETSIESNLTITGIMEKGDSWTVRIYEDLPEQDLSLFHLIFLSSGAAMLLFLGVLAYRILGFANSLISARKKIEEEEEEDEMGAIFYD